MKQRLPLTFGVGLALMLVVAAAYATDFGIRSVRESPGFTTDIEYVEGEVLVKFKEGTAQRRIAQLYEALGAGVLSSHRGGVQRMSVPDGQTEAQLISRLEDDPRVEYALLNTICHVHMIPNDPYYNPYQWNLPLINCPHAWDISAGNSVLVCILDTGIAYETYDVPQHETQTVKSGITRSHAFF